MPHIPAQVHVIMRLCPTVVLTIRPLSGGQCLNGLGGGSIKRDEDMELLEMDINKLYLQGIKVHRCNVTNRRTC